MKPEELFITSFKASLVRELADFAPRIPRGILIAKTVEEPLRIMDDTRARIMLPRFAYTTAETVNNLHAHGCAIMVWECSSSQNLRTALDWGVEGIITDAPANLALELKYRRRLRG
jgi:glycerophosphoryl diester phosphodiesterase